MPILGSNRASVATKAEAYFIISMARDNADYIVYKEEYTYYLLKKHNSQPVRYEIVSKNNRFNIKDEQGALLFDENGRQAASLNEFLHSESVRAYFQIRICPPQLHLFSGSAQQQTAEIAEIKQRLINEKDIDWIADLPKASLREQALFYFLQTFLVLDRYYDNFGAVMQGTLFKFDANKLSYRYYCAPGEIPARLNSLYELAQTGCKEAAMAHAAISFSGLYKEIRTLAWIATYKNSAILCDAGIYLELTQDGEHFPDTTQRKIFLLKELSLSAPGKKNALLKQMDIKALLSVAVSFRGRQTLAEYFDINGIDSIIAEPQLFSLLIEQGELFCAQKMMTELPESALSTTNAREQNPLHRLLHDLLKYNPAQQEAALTIFEYISKQCPDLLTASDSENKTVYDYFADIEKRQKIGGGIFLQPEMQQALKGMVENAQTNSSMII